MYAAKKGKSALGELGGAAGGFEAVLLAVLSKESAIYAAFKRFNKK